MILNDKQIYELSIREPKMVEPCFNGLVKKKEDGTPCISYGLSSFGYDIRLADHDIGIFTHKPGAIVNPKDFDKSFLKRPIMYSGNDGYGVILPAHTYMLGVSVEKFNIPDNVKGTVEAKSTYARCGIGVNVTPLEPGWRGYLTMEIHNTSDADCIIFTDEGIAQVEFNMGDRPKVTYSDRAGKYQDQEQIITLPRL